jgi:hypothetical protein
MFATTSELGGEAGSDAESVGECSYPYENYPFDQYDCEESKYLQRLAFLHREQLFLYNNGLVWTMNFVPETVDDVYNNNAYCIS